MFYSLTVAGSGGAFGSYTDTGCGDDEFAILVAVNLQTAWLSPPVALSAYFLKGVVPEWDLKDIYFGMMQFMVIQVIGLILIFIFPGFVLWLPDYLSAKGALPFFDYVGYVVPGN